WIEDCMTNHRRCNVSVMDRSWYPTRLLDCSPPERCLKLTADNYTQLLKRFPLHILSQLYQDAVYVARSLGLRYIWIDALCITQQGDQLNDWGKKLEVMGKIYSNSFCNTSVAEALDGQHVVFHSRDLGTLNTQVTRLNVAGPSKPYLIADPAFWVKEITYALANTRGLPKNISVNVGRF
ncbi:HET-domain-containing protein, partial [Macroventuria anomochaeta]